MDGGPQVTYAKARADFEYLETLADLDDFVEVDAQICFFMRSPTKAFAEQLYLDCIQLWFQEARLAGRDLTKRAQTIKERYL